MPKALSRPSLLQVAALLALIPLAIAIWQFGYNVWFGALLALPLLLGFRLSRQSNDWQFVYRVSLIAVTAVLAASTLRIMVNNVAAPPVWDFQAFWLNGRVAAEGRNFYDPQSYHEVAAAYLQPDPAFTEEILDPAFPYPPPTMFLFAPLGWFNLQTALLLWYIVQTLFLALAIITLWRMFLKQEGRLGLLLVTALTLAYRPTILTISFGQLNFMMLLMALLFFRDNGRARAGLWLALGIFTKPILAFLLLYAVLKKQWKVVAATLAALAAISLLTILVFGAHNFFPYLLTNSTARYPDWLFHEGFYQSLMAITIRLTQFDMSAGMPLLQPVFLIPALILTAVTALLVYLLRHSKAPELPFGLVLILSLLLYPATQVYYAVLLLFPLLFVWTKQTDLPFWLRTAFVTLIFALSGGYTFIALMLCWLALAALSVREVYRQDKKILQPAFTNVPG